ncbi:MAG: DNA repair protein RadA [Deltaproteobacteria bacterium RBG_13_52_11]|nr:MAG: DNA repair protein RadA [Deltaproteobacteria bacterium RBG_13_52_11]
MAKEKTVFICQTCGYQTPKWLGRCPDCQGWGTLVEELIGEEASAQGVRQRWATEEIPCAIGEVAEEEEGMRLSTRLEEFNRVLGGGIVNGSVVLLGGDPGIGKSTLIFQCLHGLASQGRRCLYISAEESLRQTKLRAKRLGAVSDELFVAAETSLERIIQAVEEIKPLVLVIDSIQSIYTSQLGSAPGSISQVRETSGRLTYLAKGLGVATFLVGHVTKDGAIAGPRVLEHIVDTVLYMEHSADSPFRILRAVKNRFGSTNEIGVFEMKEGGLQEVINPSEIFLAERPTGTSGSAVMASMEGTRPILVEIQALVSPTAFAVPRRMSIGVDYNRLSLLVAVLEKKVGINLSHQDIFVNVAGGLRIEEPAVDLGVVVAVASSHLDKVIPPAMVVFGEVGLTGEVRGVSFGEQRIREAARMGFKECILPRSSAQGIKPPEGIELITARDLREVWERLF